MTYDFILALDPSGSYHEGKGTTGWAILECASNKITKASSIKALPYPCMEAYWDAQRLLVKQHFAIYGNRMIVVIEDYLLYANKSSDQINSRMETCKLIGMLQHYCWLSGIPYHMQIAAEVKTRWSNEILQYKGYIQTKGKSIILPATSGRIDRHCIDAVRHAVHYHTFKNGRKK